MPTSRLAACLACAGALACLAVACGGNSASTTATTSSFLGRTSNGTVLIQWTRNGNKVSGSIHETFLKGGRGAGVESTSHAFTGTVAGSTLTLAVKEGRGSTNSLVGALSGGRFTLTSGGSSNLPTPITFAPGPAAEYKAAVAKLETSQTNSQESPSKSGEEPATTGTRTNVDTERVAESIEQGIAAQRNHLQATVVCPPPMPAEPGKTFTCVATTQDGKKTPFLVTVRNASGYVTYEGK